MIEDNKGSAEEYREAYDAFIEKEIMGSMGSRRFGPTYKNKFIEFYKDNQGMRTYLKSFIFCKMEGCKEMIRKEFNKEKREKLEKDRKIYEELFEELLKIKSNI